MMNKHRQLLIFLALFITIQPAYSSDFKTETIVSDLSVPWGMVLLPDKTLLVTQREGTLSQLDLKSGKIKSISGLPAIKVKGQGGLFDVAIPPSYKSGKWIYFSYNKDIDGQGATTLARAKLQDQKLVNWQDLLITLSTTKTNYHFGGRISFDNNGHLFFSVGDRGVRANAQDLSNHAGSILRLNPDGSVPIDNPFVNDNKVLSEIWSYGHRNPQGLFFNNETHQLWAIEHGPRGGDEINLIEPGKNYGWPVISYGKEYGKDIAVGQDTEREGMEQPIKVYVPSIAPSSLIQYKGDAFPDWYGTLLSGALKSKHLNQVILNKDNKAIAENRLLRSVKGRIRNIIESPEGWLYISTDDGRILRIKPSQTTDNE